MKKLLIIFFLSSCIFFIIACIFSCKKEKEIPISEQTNPISTIQQDTSLLGIWICDSAMADNGAIIIDGITTKDSTVVSSIYYRKLTAGINIYEFNFNWKTTSGDSLFIGTSSGIYLDNINTAQHFKYSFPASGLLLYENPYNNGGVAIKFWYHKK